MRNLIIAAASVAFLASAGAAMAAQQTEGTVVSVNPTSGTLTLQGGKNFVFSNGSVLQGLLPGQLVGVTYYGEGQGIGAFNPHPGSPDNSGSF